MAENTEMLEEVVEVEKKPKTARKISVVVTERFKDAHTGELHRVGDTLEITNARLKEIQKVGNFVRRG